ncbi:hypothetical protein Tco_1137578, partial [Tanacetum coccineum]
MELCTNLQQRVLDLEKTKTPQQNEIASLKRRSKAEQKEVKNSNDADNEIFDVDALTGDEVFAEQEVAAKDVNLTVDEVTLAQALAALKSVKPKVKGIIFQEPGESTTTTKSTPTISSQQSQDKGKGIMIEEPIKPMKKKDPIRLDEEVALKLQGEFDEEERLRSLFRLLEKETNIALIEEW